MTPILFSNQGIAKIVGDGGELYPDRISTESLRAQFSKSFPGSLLSSRLAMAIRAELSAAWCRAYQDEFGTRHADQICRETYALVELVATCGRAHAFRVGEEQSGILFSVDSHTLATTVYADIFEFEEAC